MDSSVQHNYRGAVRAVVADLAGTTVDYGSCAPAGAFVELFARHGVEVTPAQARGPMGLHKRDHIRTLAEMPEIAEQWSQRQGGPCSENDIDALYAEFIPLQVACLPKFGDVIPGVVETVAGLRERGVRLAVTTGYNREMMGVVLESAARQGLLPEAAVCAEDVPMGRPAPWMLFRAMETLGVYPPAAVLAIGDTLPDIDAGRNAAVWTVGVALTGNMVGLTQAEWSALSPAERDALLREARQALVAGGAHYVIDAFDELPGVIDAVDRRLAAGETP